MSSVTIGQPSVATARPALAVNAGVGSWISDTAVLIKRNILHIIRTPELLLDVTIQPIMFVVLFRFVFGGAIPIEGTSYVNYLMAGIFVQTIAFALLWSGVLLANDLQKGLIDRFRSLPMKAWTVLAARTTTDLLRSLIAITIMVAVGLAVGFRPDASVGQWVEALAIMLLFGFALAWVGITLGMTVRTPEAVQGALFVVVMPLTFASSAFVPTDTMPGWLKAFTEHQPITLVINAVRALLLGRDPGSAAWQSIVWSIGILIVFFPLALVMYRKRTTD
jgi:ABC-2 type transport system permease protein/oleandomycin transport system permease protein